jgi:hypothetical protein
MKTAIRLVFALLPVLILSACASEAPRVNRSEQDYAVHMSVARDNIIVPGDRVGPVFLGMTDVDLYKRMGDPTNTFQSKDGSTSYQYGGLMVYVFPDHKVRFVYINEGYYTKEGVAVGTSNLALLAKLGKPSWNVLFNPTIDQFKNCYDDGLIVTTRNGNVDGFAIVHPGC